MNHADHVSLLRDGILNSTDQVWADLGSGGGAFTLALADLLGPTGQIYSVDKNASSLKQQEQAMRTTFPGAKVHYQVADFMQRLDLPPLDGIVMANSLHFIPDRQKEAVLKTIRHYLRPNGRFLLVEHNVDSGNPWVPHPLSYKTWEALSTRVGFSNTRLLATRPSSFLREIFSAVSLSG
jgi:ubiquinone/menaquinone biosynthesis C-methylase UbiE